MQASGVVSDKYTSTFETFKKILQGPSLKANCHFEGLDQVVKNILSKREEIQPEIGLKKIELLDRNYQTNACQIVKLATETEKQYFQALYKQIEGAYESKNAAAYTCFLGLIQIRTFSLKKFKTEAYLAFNELMEKTLDFMKQGLSHLNQDSLSTAIRRYMEAKTLDQLALELQPLASPLKNRELAIETLESLEEFKFRAAEFLITANKCGFDLSSLPELRKGRISKYSDIKAYLGHLKVKDLKKVFGTSIKPQLNITS